MINYKKGHKKSPIESVDGKWYIQLVHGEQTELGDLAAHMASHNSPFSKGVINGVLTDMVACIKELLLDGKTVKLADLAIFSLGVRCTGAVTRDEATVDNIRGFVFNARGTGALTPMEVQREAHLKELREYSKE